MTTPLVRFPLRLDTGNPYVYGKEIFSALEKLAKNFNTLLFKEMVKYFEGDGTYWRMGLILSKVVYPVSEVAISYGSDPHSAIAEINLEQHYNSNDLYVENIPCSGIEESEAVVAFVKEVRDSLGEILKNG